MKNELLEEVWRIRERISVECGHNLDNLAARMKRLELDYSDRLARLPVRRRSEPEATEALREEPPKAG